MVSVFHDIGARLINRQNNLVLRNGPAGDVIVVIEEEPHQHLVRNGDDVVLDLLVSFPEAALGAEVTVPTLSGRAKLKIEPGTQSGRILRMRDKGISRRPGGERVSTILYPTVDAAAREQTITIHEPVRGAPQARVALRPVNLLELEELLRAGRTRQSQRAELAQHLAFGQQLEKSRR